VLGPASSGPVSRTMTYLVMSTDDDHGHLRLADGKLRFDWPGIGKRPVFRRDNDMLDRATEVLHGTYVANVLDTRLGGHGLVTVHPLGGCDMGDDGTNGVVDDHCRVFDTSKGSSFHRGLYVMDGSVIPRPLTVNPLLTISAVSERACKLLIDD